MKTTLKQCLNASWFKWTLSFLAGLIAATALCIQTELVETLTKAFKTINGYSISWAIIFLSVSVLFRIYTAGSRRPKFSYTVLILSLLFSAFIVVGRSYYHLASWDFIFANSLQFGLATFVFIGYFILFYSGLQMLLYYLEKSDRFSLTDRNYSGIAAVFRRHTILLSMGIMLVCWLPIYVVYFPGSVPHDGLNQLNMYYGIDVLRNSHPVFVTWLMGLSMSVGRLFGSDHLGIVIYIAFQSFVCAYAFSYSIHSLSKWKMPLWFQVIVLCYFSLLPIWAAYAQAVIKDTLFSGIFVLYVIQLLAILKHQPGDSYPWQNWISLCIISLLLCLTHNNLIFLIILLCVILFFTLKGNLRRKVIASTTCAIALFLLFSSVLLPALGIPSSDIKEALSLPFQQTARYVSQYPDEVTEEERLAIDDILNYERVVRDYNPELSDPVKNTYRFKASKYQLFNYFKIWGKMFLKHPGTYVQATLNHIYGYFYPGAEIENRSIFQFYIKGEPVNTGFFSIFYTNTNSSRDAVRAYCYAVGALPGIGLLYRPAFYTWITILLLSLLIRKKRYKALIGLLPSLMAILTCCASPVNALVRYMLPVMAATPLLIAWTVYQLDLVRAQHCANTPQ